MEYIGFCIFFGTAMACMLTNNLNSYVYVAAAIGMGLCSIAKAIKSVNERNK